MAIGLAVTAAFVVIVGQLWYLQVLEGGRFLDASDRNRIRIRPIAAPRGILFDRHGVPLVDNRPAFTLSLIPRELPRDPASRDAVLGRVAALLRGYVREANEDQLRQGRYRRGEMVGQSGLERLLDEHLRGQDGGERIEVDAMGRPVRLIQQSEPHSGAQVVTTVDGRIQEAAERAMAGHAGAVVVMDPRNGDLLAMVSTPAFEIDRFTGTIDRSAWLRLVQDPHFPLLNRAVQSQYAPASIFKILVAAAALQEGSLTPADRTQCAGEFHLGTATFKDWKEGGHGTVDLQRAIVQSCNIFFYQAGLKVGGVTLVRYARAFGFGAPTGIELQGEKYGLVPRPDRP